MLRATALVALLATLPACDGEETGADAAVADAAPQGDGGTTSGGLSFEFVTAPALPDIGGDVTVDELRLVLRDVRAVGDSAPGDARTSIGELSLHWQEDSAPPPLVFASAPPGIYSNFEARLGVPASGEDSLEVRGKVLVAGELRDFRIENDDLSVRVELGLDGLMVAGEPRVATIAVSLAFLRDVPWDRLASEDGELRIESGDPEMPAIVTALSGAFSLQSVR